MKKFILVLLMLAPLMTPTFAQEDDSDFSLDNLSQADFNGVAEEFGANFVHSTASGASSLGNVFGFEIGVLGRMTGAPQVEGLVKEQDPDSDISDLYDAGLVAIVSIPFGITAELTFLPEIDLGDLDINKTTFGLKWTMTDGLFVLPFNLALRAHYSTASISYKDTLNNDSTGNTDVDAEIGIDSKSYGFNVSASIDAFVIEPYAGLGFVSSTTDLGVTASGGANIFTFTDSQSASSSKSGVHYFAGAQVNLLAIHLAAEYSNVYGIDRYTAKLSFGF